MHHPSADPAGRRPRPCAAQPALASAVDTAFCALVFFVLIPALSLILAGAYCREWMTHSWHIVRSNLHYGRWLD
jgi:hypothetical protein